MRDFLKILLCLYFSLNGGHFVNIETLMRVELELLSMGD